MISDTLDGKQISETSKQFLKNWHANKETQKQKKAEILRRGETFIDATQFSGKIALIYNMYVIRILQNEVYKPVLNTHHSSQYGVVPIVPHFENAVYT